MTLDGTFPPIYSHPDHPVSVFEPLVIAPSVENTEPDQSEAAFKPYSQNNEIFVQLRQAQIPTIEFIPKQSGPTVSRIYRKLLQDVIQDPSDLDAWATLQLFPLCVLRQAPKRSAISASPPMKQWKFTRECLRRWDTGTYGQEQLWQEALAESMNKPPPASSSSQASNRKQCMRRVQQGRFSDALKALLSAGTVAFTPEVMETLKRLHPPAPPPPIPNMAGITPLVVDEESVIQAIRSFRNGTACGYDGIRPQHLMNMYHGQTEIDRIRSPILRNNTSMVNLLLAGKAHPKLAPLIASAPLIAIAKPKGGIRPIAIGEIWRRLAAKCVVVQAKQLALQYLAPLQVGVGVKGGSDATVHTFRRLYQDNKSRNDVAILKLDFANAFNSVSRAPMLQAVADHIPDLLPWVSFCYSSAPMLFAGDKILFSETGVQQGDPLGPFLFALTIHPLIKKIAEKFPDITQIWFLDDGTLYGPPSILKEIFDLVKSEGPRYGLTLNDAKCEIWWPNLNLELCLRFPPEVIRNDSCGTDLLGAPLGSQEFAEKFVQSRVQKIDKIKNEIEHLNDPHIQLILLRSCWWMPKMNFALRSCPPELIQEAIKTFDRIINEGLHDITQAPIDLWSRLKFSLSVKVGGAGIPIASNIAIAAYLGSLVQTIQLQNRMLGLTDPDSIPVQVTDTYDNWREHTQSIGDAPSDGWALVSLNNLLADKRPQKTLTQPIQEGIFRRLFSSASTRHQALIQSTTCNSSGAWLNALPLPYYGLTMQPQVFRNALMYRMGIPVRRQEECKNCACGASLDRYGDHDVSCGRDGRFWKRHNAVRDLLYDMASSVGLEVKKEAPHLLGDDNGERPADLLLGNHGPYLRNVCVDVTVVSPLTKQDQCSKEAGYMLRITENLKRQRYATQCAERDLEFSPFAIETLGGLGEATKTLIKTLAAKFAEKDSIPLSMATNRLRQRIVFTVQKYVGAAIEDDF